MSNLTKTEIRIIKHYNPNESPEENAQKISEKTRINVNTCRSYITTLRKNLNFNDYYYGEEDRLLSPTESSEVIEAHNRQNSHKNGTRLSKLEQEEIQLGVQKIVEDLYQEQKDLVMAHFYEGATYDKIAEDVGISRQAIGSRMQRILKRLRAHAIEKGLHNYIQ